MEFPGLLLVVALVVGGGTAEQLEEALDQPGAVQLVGRNVAVIRE